MARPSNTDSRRAEIAAALGRVMTRNGYDGATVGAIAREAGLTPGLLHYHFASKAAILGVLVDSVVARSERRIATRLDAATTPGDRLAAILDGLLAVGPDADPEAVGLWTQIGAEAVRSPDVRAAYATRCDRLHTQLTDAVAHVCRQEGRAPDAASGIATALLAFSEGTFTLAATTPLVPTGTAAALAHNIASSLIDAQPATRSTVTP